MKLRRRSKKLLMEPPEAATGDIAFILIIFFLVCASVQPDSGRKQELPRSEEKEEKTEQSQNVEVVITRDSVLVNGNPHKLPALAAKLQTLLGGKTTESDRVVVVKSRKDTPYHFWIDVTGKIEAAGGIITMQIEEDEEVLR